MTKVLYIGVYRDKTGWGQAATDQILALDAAGVEVVPRPLKLQREIRRPPERIRELERRTAEGCDVVIQHLLPHHMEYDGHFVKNIGMFESETDSFRWSHWPERLNLMDEVWCINHQQKVATYASGVNVPARVVPHATDITRFQKRHKPLERLGNQLEGGFTFYTIGEFVRRKNLPALIKAFHLEFEPHEPVNLLIKTSKHGLSPDETAKHVGAMCDQIKTDLKLYRRLDSYHREIVITQRFSDEDLLRLHATCDCFVSPSFGEAWCIPAFDAMALGNTPIVTACGGFVEYLSSDSGWLVPGREEPVFGEKDTFQDLFTSRENWTSINIRHLRRCMREAYENAGLRSQKAETGIDRAYDFTYVAVGQIMKGYLEA
jgi:glycosyltransferase involved in cell wall biosynthesis